jgi:hypothetical protein
MTKGCWIPIGDEVEAFVHGVLLRSWGGIAPWLYLNELAHGSMADLQAQVGPQVAVGRDPDNEAWTHVVARLAREILGVIDHPDQLRELQSRFLWPLEDELIAAEHEVVPTPGELYRLVHGALGPLVESTSGEWDDRDS